MPPAASAASSAGALPARALSALLPSPLPAEALPLPAALPASPGKKPHPADGPAGEGGLEPRAPPALEAAKPPGQRDRLGRASPRSDSAELQKSLCDFICIGSPRRAVGRRRRSHFAQTVAQRRVCGGAASVFFHGRPGAGPQNLARRLGIPSSHERRTRSWNLPVVGRQSAFVCRAGSDRCNRALNTVFALMI